MNDPNANRCLIDRDGSDLSFPLLECGRSSKLAVVNLFRTAQLDLVTESREITDDA